MNNKLHQQKFSIFLLALSFFLASCSTHIKRTDGPPKFYVDETKIPNAKPKPEKLSKYGNMRSYVVFGRRYYVMRSSRNYSAVGVASWYGTMFHARNTSSGEPYNMLAMTAAHKSLPLPTYVEVVNLKNRRKVIVKVNDRGPFRSNRLIDLSYVAAKKLGMLGKGTAPVRVTAIDPYHPYQHYYQHYYQHQYHYQPYHYVSATPTKKIERQPQQKVASSWRIVKYHSLPPSRQSSLYLQVGAFKNIANAKNLQKKLIALLKTNVIITPPLKHESLFRVKIGPFNDVTTADKLTARLKLLGIAVNRSSRARI